jgi:hypothetical protein
MTGHVTRCAGGQEGTGEGPLSPTLQPDVTVVRSWSAHASARMMREWRVNTIGGLIAGMLLVSGCAGDVVPLPRVDPTQAGEIVVIYPRGVEFFCGPLPLTVTLDGQDVYRLACGEHVVFTVPVGERRVGINHWTRPAATSVSVSAGSRSHMRLVFAPGPRLKQTTPSDGERLMRDPWTKASTPTSR